MGESLGGAGQVGAGARGHGVFAVAEDQVAAHSGGEVEDDVGSGVADAADGFAIEFGVAGGLAGLGVADVNVGDGGAGFGGGDGGFGNLRRSDGNEVAASGGVARAGEGASDEDVGLHGGRGVGRGGWEWEPNQTGNARNGLAGGNSRLRRPGSAGRSWIPWMWDCCLSGDRWIPA